LSKNLTLKNKIKPIINIKDLTKIKIKITQIWIISDNKRVEIRLKRTLFLLSNEIISILILTWLLFDLPVLVFVCSLVIIFPVILVFLIWPGYLSFRRDLTKITINKTKIGKLKLRNNLITIIE